MSNAARLRLLVATAATLAIAGAVVTFFAFPPPLPGLVARPNAEWAKALATLFALSVLSTVLALKVTEGGSTTSMDFIPQLAAVLLLGPSGAVILAATSWALFQFAFLKNPPVKAIYNVSQIIIAVALASFIFTLLGEPNLHSLGVTWDSIIPFAAAVVALFFVNTIAVATAVAISQGQPFRKVWQSFPANMLAFDFVMSPLAFVVAYAYIRFQSPFALLLAVVPLIGLRYSYGVNIELQQLNSDLLRVLIKTIEARDPYTSGHSLRVSERARVLAEALELRARDARIVETSALLHDIGKIDLVYGEILRQKGPLTPEQRELIRAHPARGVEIISSIRSLDPLILRCVRHHHERYDGEGYPDGLAAENIPLGARIIMVCDTVDAMMTVRPYRDALSSEVVIQELKRHSGTQFDPKVVEAALRPDIVSQIVYSFGDVTTEDSRPLVAAAN